MDARLYKLGDLHHRRGASRAFGGVLILATSVGRIQRRTSSACSIPRSTIIWVIVGEDGGTLIGSDRRHHSALFYLSSALGRAEP